MIQHNKTMKMKSVFTITVIALSTIAAFAQTPPRRHSRLTTTSTASTRNAVITKKAKVPVTYLGVDT
jgi:hypothetical protein